MLSVTKDHKVQKIASEALNEEVECGLSQEQFIQQAAQCASVIGLMLDHNEIRLQQTLSDVLDELNKQGPAIVEVERSKHAKKRKKRVVIGEEARAILMKELAYIGQAMKNMSARRMAQVAEMQARKDNVLPPPGQIPRGLLESPESRWEARPRTTSEWETATIDLAAMKPAGARQ